MWNGVTTPECIRKSTGNKLNSYWCNIQHTFFQNYSQNKFSLGVHPKPFFGMEGQREETIPSYLGMAYR